MGIFDSIKRKLGNDIKNSNGINEEYANKGLIRRKYFKKNGKLDGKYIEYIVGNDNWIKAEIDYENGLKNGLQCDACSTQAWVGCLQGVGGMSQVAGLKDHVGGLH